MRSLLLSLIPVVFYAFVSCQKSDTPAPAPQPQAQLKVDSTSLNLEGNKNSIDSFTIQYTGNWTITITPSTTTWLKTNVSSGTGNTKIYVSVEQDNISGTTRAAIITIIPNSEVPKAVNIAVTQQVYNTTIYNPTNFSMVWSRVFGGTGGDIFPSIIKTSDDGFLAVGYTSTQDGDISFNHGTIDIWAIKLDGSGNKEWEKSYGGSLSDYGASIVQSQDGGYFIAGTTNSSDGDVTNKLGGTDLWVLKIDATGKLLWQRTLGGTAFEENALHGITISPDGGCVVVSRTSSNNGDVSGNHGDDDIWVVKLNASGNKIWQKTLGGSRQEEAHAIASSPDGGYMVAGFTSSNDGDVSGNHGGKGKDAWIVKLDANGNKVWQKTLGGTGNDVANDIISTADGGCITVGFTDSNDGDVSGNHSGMALNDYWLVKLDTHCNMVWQKTLGGKANDEAYSIAATHDKGYIITGVSQSNDGDVSNNHGGSGADAWVVKIDTTGRLIWQKMLGGTDNEAGMNVVSINDGTYIMSGISGSNDGDVSGNHGNIDGWIVKFRDQ